MQNDELKARLRAESGRLAWDELAPHYARGVVVRVSAGLDLIEVGAAFAEDNVAQVTAWLEGGAVARASEDDARHWTAGNMEFEALVVAPWVVVKET